ncbi:nucleotide exchange factor GrpE [Robertkochia sediminum]|uniref:nucleotide exchange factor GrpE n=1 Tax=Robertkochia sediminum TaxID=2785326 RepID=UPI00193386C4|nr:nucleotide exchange factor GrpE [Robertkochia sediminum]MBL7472275.1 nucleotide exchange factor GrpE [Robertkochia sediminum]
MAKKDKETDALQDDMKAQNAAEAAEAKQEEKSEQELMAEELAKEKDKFVRLFAEFENYKKRTSKERVELFKTAGQDVMQAMLPVLDDFDRALNELGKTADEGVLKGVELINNKLRDILTSKGLAQVAVAQGDVFDPEVHDAITQIPAPSEDLKGKIIDVVEKGYTLGDRIIRHPKVVVGQA